MAKEPGDEHEHLNLDDIDGQQREIMSRNILVISAALDELVDQIVEHLKYTKAMCPLACVGGAATRSLHGLGEVELLMLSTLALRRLAEQQYDRKEVGP
jgi:UTP:GlnB (protein PII) uridylyltransferase